MENEERKPYSKPVILQELDLETRAGSILGIPSPFDLTDPAAPGTDGN